MVSLVIILTLLLVGGVIGSFLESRHYTAIREREANGLSIPASSFKHPDIDPLLVQSCQLAIGSTVVSVDYLKQFLAGLRLIFGGEIKSYSSLIDRARREANLRMRQSAPGADAFYGCRYATSSISQGAGRAIGSVEVICYATAVTFRDDAVRTEDPSADRG